MADEFSTEELDRYARHFSLAGFGLAAQQELRSAKILIVGCGGLGSPVAQYLAAAGVGTIGLADFDIVSLSNLQRQVLYQSADVGRQKTNVASERILAMNPNIRVHSHNIALKAANISAIADDYPIIIDCSDNFATRYLLNDYCVIQSKVLVSAAVSRFEGQVMVVDTAQGACYRCLFPEPPQPGTTHSCAEEGVIGVLPGIAGTIQATEAVKLITGIGEPLVGRLLTFNALRMQFRSLNITKDPDCSVCGINPRIRELLDYELICGQTVGNVAVSEISAAELKNDLNSGKKYQLLDVRSKHEFIDRALFGAYQIPLDELAGRTAELVTDMETITICGRGTRSKQALQILQAKGFKKVRSLAGGMDAWLKFAP